MEFSHLQEHTTEGPWIAPAGQELTPPEAEFTPLGSEFTPPGAEFSSDRVLRTEPQASKQRHSKRYLAAFLLLVGFTLAGTVTVSQPETTSDISPASAAMEPVSPTVPPTVSPPTEETEPPALASVHIVVYAGFWEAEQDAILLDETVPGNDVEALNIPQPEAQPGYRFLGYALLHKDTEGNQFDQQIADTIPEEVVRRCAPDSNRIIQLRLQGVWCAEPTEKPFLPLILDPNDGDEAAVFDASSPKLSGTTVYLAAYPAPSRPGWHFLGWYSAPEGGERVFCLLASDFYGKDDEETDWRAQQPITLYAHWEPMN